MLLQRSLQIELHDEREGGERGWRGRERERRESGWVWVRKKGNFSLSCSNKNETPRFMEQRESERE